MISKGDRFIKKRNKVEFIISEVKNDLVSFFEVGFMNIKQMDKDDFLELFERKTNYSFVLIKVTPDGNGVRDYREEMVVSDSEKNLKKYCEMSNIEIGEHENFSWNPYYLIEPSKLKIV